MATGGVRWTTPRHQREDQLSPPGTSFSPPPLHLQDGGSGGEGPGFEFGAAPLDRSPRRLRAAPGTAAGVVTARAKRPLTGFFSFFFSYISNANNFCCGRRTSQTGRLSCSLCREFVYCKRSFLNKFSKCTSDVWTGTLQLMWRTAVSY